MTREDAGKYATKHPSGITLNERIAKAIREKSVSDTLACGAGEKISKDLEVTISEVGITADLLGIKINKCQLGLFGWGKKSNHGQDISHLKNLRYVCNWRNWSLEPTICGIFVKMRSVHSLISIVSKGQ